MPAVIEANSLSKHYRGGRGIDDLTLSVERGEIFGFLDPNGAGKTTTIRTLLDLLHPTSGSAKLFGLDSHQHSLEIRARIGNLPGDFAFEDSMTGSELLTLFARLRGLDGMETAHSLADRFKADLSKPLRELSRGNRQKVGIIQAMFHGPELLILDEPTSGLDPLMQEEFLSVIAEHRAAGKTVFLSSHDLPEVERVCDRVGVIRDGKLITVASVDEMRERAYRKVVVRFADGVTVDPSAFERINGVGSASLDGQKLSFKAMDNLDEVIAALGRYKVVDIEVTKPSLEELFIAFYSEGQTA